jgi:hypothetical protein
MARDKQVSEWEEFTAYRGLIADAKREERERIIELLKEKRAKFIEMRWLAEADMVTDSIALIEGENK